MATKRALTVNDIRDYKPQVLPFDGEWHSSIGNPELKGGWIIWGNSANGKTRFALQLAKYLSKFVRVAYDSLEEGLSLSMQKAIIDVGMSDVKRSFVLLDKETVPMLRERLAKQRSPQVVIIDSLQYTGLNYKDYTTLINDFPHKMFILVSHADGKEPRGNVGKAIKYDAFVKIYVEGYMAFAQSRYGGGEPYVVWKKGADEYWNGRNV